MNILQIQDRLKSFSQEQLVQEMSNPSGQIPQFLTLTEMNRRRKMQQDMQSQQGQQPTVAEEAIAAAGVPQGGLQSMAQSMAPNSSLAQNTGVAPTPGMKYGGVVGMQPGGMVGNVPISLMMSDPTVMAMAAQRGMTPAEYLASAGDPALEQQARRMTRNRFMAMEPVGDGINFPTQAELDDAYAAEKFGFASARQMPAPQPGGGVGAGGLPSVMQPPTLAGLSPTTAIGVPAPEGSPPIIDLSDRVPYMERIGDPAVDAMLDDEARNKVFTGEDQMFQFGFPTAPQSSFPNEPPPPAAQVKQLEEQYRRRQEDRAAREASAQDTEASGLTFGLPSVAPETSAELSFGDLKAQAQPEQAKASTSGGAGAGGVGAPGFSKAEELLRARMDELSEAEQQNKALAMANFGLALMAGQSGNFGVDVGQAGMAALKGMQAGMADIRGREQALQDAEINMALEREKLAYAARAAAAKAAAKPAEMKEWQVQMRLAPIMSEIKQIDEALNPSDPYEALSLTPQLEETYRARRQELYVIAQNMLTSAGIPSLSAVTLPE